ncbi:hypothetical protein DITRI_Ditri06bG0174500 [Diplodiscus trichospermus]
MELDGSIMVFDEDVDLESAFTSNNSSPNFDSLSASWMQSTPQVNLVNAYQTLPNLGLKLSITPCLLEKLEQLAQVQNSIAGAQTTSHHSAYATAKPKSKYISQHVNKMKAENFPISLLRIGSWQRVSRNEGDLVAKCYFAKRKLVWEFLENGLKSKIEIQWSDILSLMAVMNVDRPGILEIELNHPPSFHHEIDPQPRKHTQWRMVSDFTGGAALTFRRHHLEFPPGALEKPLEKLLRYDRRLCQLSRQGYPSLDSPYFHKHTIEIDFSMEFHGQRCIVPQQQQQQQQFSFSNVSAHNHPQHFQIQESLNFKDPNSPTSDEHVNNQIMPLQDQGTGMLLTADDPNVNSTISLQDNHMCGYVQMPVWDQGKRMFLTADLTTTMTVNSTIPPPTSSMPSYVQKQWSQGIDVRDSLITNQVRGNQGMVDVNNLQNMPLNNSQTLDTNLANKTSNPTTNYEQNMVTNIVDTNNNLCSWSQSQVFCENMNMLSGNNLLSSSVNSDPTMKINDWTWKFG